jgi:hypothetical protein
VYREQVGTYVISPQQYRPPSAQVPSRLRIVLPGSLDTPPRLGTVTTVHIFKTLSTMKMTPPNQSPLTKDYNELVRGRRNVAGLCARLTTKLWLYTPGYHPGILLTRIVEPALNFSIAMVVILHALRPTSVCDRGSPFISIIINNSLNNSQYL